MYHPSTKKPTSKSWGYFIDEKTRLIDAWVTGSLLKNTIIMIMSSLLLQGDYHAMR